jgi:hypothetical protein
MLDTTIRQHVLFTLFVFASVYWCPAFLIYVICVCCRIVVSSMSYVRYLCLLAYSGVQHVLFTLFVFASAEWCPTCLIYVICVCWGIVVFNMCYLRYLCLLAYSGVQHVLFTLFVFSSVYLCQTPANTNNVNKTCWTPLYASKHK